MTRNDDLIPYKGSWIYPVDGGWEGNLYGFHYSSDSIDDLKNKIDKAVEQLDFNKVLNPYLEKPKHYSIFNEDGEEETGPEWLVQIELSSDEYDDSMEESSIKKVIFNAPDFDTAVKYSQQYIRKQAREYNEWKDAKILSISQVNNSFS